MRVVIAGAGFGGLAAARSLARLPVDVTVVDRRNFHLFQPLLYQVATGGLSPANIASPVRALLRRQRNARVVLGEVEGVDVAGKRLLLGDGELPWDVLLLATGARPAFFGHPDWERWAPGLKTLEDALEIRRRIYEAFETAERQPAHAREEGLLTFVVIGGGPTGVELAGALAEIARHALRREFRAIDSASARVVLIENADRVLPPHRETMSARALADLRRLGVDVRLRTRVTDIAEGRVTFASEAGEETLVARTIVWAAGVEASPLGGDVARQVGLEPDRMGRLRVAPDLSLPGHPDVLVIGDLASLEQDGRPLPGVAPCAMQQGRHVGRVIAARLAGRDGPAFRYHDKGQLATIGRTAAVCEIGRLELTGYAAWIFWLFLHLFYLVDLENRLLVFVQWAWNYVTFSRAARLITGAWRPGAPRP
jgi:NADH dehydrogenase